MNVPVFEGVLTIVLPLVGLTLCALGLFALGRWLRKRGHGERLDAINAVIVNVQQKTDVAARPLAVGAARFGRALNALPLFGSKRQRQQWDTLEVRPRKEQGKD